MRTFPAAFLILTSSLCCVVADEGPLGVPARPVATDYGANTHYRNAVLAASLVPAKQVEHLFAFDISRTYVVFEVAVYANGEPLRVARQAFSVKVNASGDAIHNAEPATVASSIQRKNLPPMPSEHGANVDTTAVIGVAHGTDPYSGRRVTNVYSGAEVDVRRGEQPPVYAPPKPGATFEDRQMLEAQLRARSLPEGAVERAVAGYLYFRKADLKTQPNDSYALEYLADDNGSGATHAVTISVPRKAH